MPKLPPPRGKKAPNQALPYQHHEKVFRDNSGKPIRIMSDGSTVQVPILDRNGKVYETADGEIPDDQPRQKTKKASRVSPLKKVDPKFPLFPVEDGPETTAEASPVEVAPVGVETPLGSLLRKSIEEVEARADTSPHLIVIARAGTGKTTTLIEGMKLVKGLPSTLIPSPQQAAVWDCMKLSAGKVSSICFAAFNSTIAKELQSRVPEGCEAMTLHSLGVRSVNASLGRFALNKFRVLDLLAELLGIEPKGISRTMPVLASAVNEIVGLVKVNLSSFEADGNQLSPEDHEWERVIDDILTYYDIDLDGQGRSGNRPQVRRQIIQYVPKIIDLCKDPKKDGCIDFDDMIWLPIALDLPINQFDFLLIDESQDLSKCQQALARRAGKRMVFCGDNRQAIYAFAGADSDSLPRLSRELKKVDRGCIELPLTVTRRCGKAIVREAKLYVPDFEAHESNPDGKVGYALYPLQKGPDGFEELPYDKTYLPLVQDGDFILCRYNAPLVTQAFKFIQAGRKATIIGRDLARNLIKTVEKQKASTTVELIEKLEKWLRAEIGQEQARTHPSETKIAGLQDRFLSRRC